MSDQPSSSTNLASIVSDCVDKAYLMEVKAGNIKGATSFAHIAKTIKGHVTQRFAELGLEDHPAILAVPEPSTSRKGKKNGPKDKVSVASPAAAVAPSTASAADDNDGNDESALDESAVEPLEWFVEQFNQNTTVLPSPKYKWCNICNRWMSKLTEHNLAHSRHTTEEGAVICPLPAVDASRTVCLQQYPDQTALRSHVNRDHRIKNERMKPGIPVSSPLGQLMLRAEERGVNHQDASRED